MHYLYFVLLERDETLNSESARNAAKEFLNMNGFADQQGRFSCGKADWFVIGGRWSGCLTKALGKKADADKLHILVERKKYDEFRKSPTSAWCPAKMSQKKFESEVRKYTKDEFRDTYKDEGYEDDAMILTPKLRKGLQKKYRPNKKMIFGDAVEVSDASPEGGEMVLSNLEKEHDGRWIVAVDYHC